MDKRKNAFPAVGGSSLLVIFAVLCLCIFAFLSLSTALAGQRLSRQSAEAVSGYYAAAAEAEEIMARLRAGERPEMVREEAGVYTYDCPVSATQVLSVALDGGNWEKLRWQVLSTTDWQADDSLTVWDGELS